MVSEIRLYVHRRDTRGSDPAGFNSQPVHVKKVMFLIFVLGAIAVYLLISGKA